jgi:hypothetical protein
MNGLFVCEQVLRCSSFPPAAALAVLLISATALLSAFTASTAARQHAVDRDLPGRNAQQRALRAGPAPRLQRQSSKVYSRYVFTALFTNRFLVRRSHIWLHAGHMVTRPTTVVTRPSPPAACGYKHGFTPFCRFLSFDVNNAPCRLRQLLLMPPILKMPN